jgi:hypothetical protein
VSEPELITEEGLDAMIAGLALLDDPAVVEGLLRCRECGGSLALQRSDAHHCSDRCRLRAWRKGKRSAPGL